jgi:DNA-directed RNA polymerase subunit K/omega
MDFKKVNAPKTTTTQNLNELAAPTGNIYETVTILAKRAEQIGQEMKRELHEKLEEFNVHTETLEEIFENKEQIELSKIYENLAKPVTIAVQEWKDGKVYYRYPEAK